MDTNTTPLLAWQAPARPDHVRSERWYLVTGLATATIVAYGILTGTWTVSLVAALSAGLYYLVRNEKQPLHNLQVTEYGLSFDGRFSAWDAWNHFWILEGPGYHELHVSPKSSFKAEIVIQTGGMDPLVVRDTLGLYLPQIAHQNERLLDAIIRFCKL